MAEYVLKFHTIFNSMIFLADPLYRAREYSIGQFGFVTESRLGHGSLSRGAL
jgi:hypothetical protein